MCSLETQNLQGNKFISESNKLWVEWKNKFNQHFLIRSSYKHELNHSSNKEIGTYQR